MCEFLHLGNFKLAFIERWSYVKVLSSVCMFVIVTVFVNEVAVFSCKILLRLTSSQIMCIHLDNDSMYRWLYELNCKILVL